MALRPPFTGDHFSKRYVPIVATIAAVASMNLANVENVEILRYASNYDLCRMLWTKVVQPANVAPTHAMKIQDSNGLWFALDRNQTLYAEMFGCKSSVGANQAFIAQAQVFAAGKEVVFQSGKDYAITAALALTGDTNFVSDGAQKATISSATQTFDLITISCPASTVNTTLSESVQINTDNWSVTSATGIVPGMLMEVVSSKSWYHDPRPLSSDARKGELHVVTKVEGSAVYTRDTAFDGYDLAAPETVTLTFFNPIRVNFENIGLKAAPFTAVGDTTHKFAGLTVQYAMEPFLKNVDIDGVQGQGISLFECYRPVVEGGHSHTVNHWGTGYGVNTAGCTHPVVRFRHFWQCRRGVDFSGLKVPTRHPLVHDCVVSTGGISSEGTQYGWLDDDSNGAEQFGFGSHGPCDGAVYRNNRTGPMHTPYECRGRNEHVLNNIHVGRTRGGFIEVGSGENLDVIGNQLYDGWTGMGESDIFNGASNANARRAEAFIQFNYLTAAGDGYEGRATGRIMVRDNDVQIQDQFIIFNSDSPTFAEEGIVYNLTVRNNKVRFATPTGSTECFLLYNQKAVASLPVGWHIGPNDIARVGGTGRVWRQNSTIDLRDVTSRFDARITKFLRFTDDSAQSFAVPDVCMADQVRVRVDTSNNGAYGDVLVRQGATTLSSFGTVSNVEASSGSSLAGTTGNDTKLTLCLNAGILYVENRLGAAVRVTLTIDQAM